MDKEVRAIWEGTKSRQSPQLYWGGGCWRLLQIYKRRPWWVVEGDCCYKVSFFDTKAFSASWTPERFKDLNPPLLPLIEKLRRRIIGFCSLSGQFETEFYATFSESKKKKKPNPNGRGKRGPQNGSRYSPNKWLPLNVFFKRNLLEFIVIYAIWHFAKGGRLIFRVSKVHFSQLSVCSL